MQTTRDLIERVSSTLDRLLETKLQVRDRESRLSAIVQNVADGILTITPTGRIVEYNAATKEILGLMRDETPQGRTLHEFLMPRAIPLLEHSLEELVDRTRNGETVEKRLTLPVLRADHKEIDVSLALRLIPDSSTPLMTAVLSDITMRKRYEEQLVYMANHDTLTNLPNRSLLEHSLSDALQAHKDNAGSRNGATAILFIDLDRFKVINDSLGHDVGDLLLKAVGQRLQKVIRRQEIVGRLGGDEFLIIIPDLKETQDAAILSQAVLDALAPSFDIKGRVLFVTPSIGIALYPSDGEDFPTLMRNADTAMYSAKSSGGGTYHFFTKTMNESAMARLVIRKRTARGPCQQPVRTALPTQARPAHQPCLRPRSADSLETARAGVYFANAIHTRCRRNRSDRENWRMGLSRSVPADFRMGSTIATGHACCR